MDLSEYVFPNSDSFLGRYKILLPNMIIAIGLSIVGVAAWKILPKDEIQK